ncbi:hypothetical protein ES703_122745 [subsurface metagenome]
MFTDAAHYRITVRFNSCKPVTEDEIIIFRTWLNSHDGAKSRSVFRRYTASVEMPETPGQHLEATIERLGMFYVR